MHIPIRALLISSVFLFSISGLLYSQHYIEYDFANAPTNINKSVNFGEECVVKIVNINLRHYTITDGSTKSTYNIEVPSAFSGISISPFIQGQNSDPIQMQNNISVLTSAMSEVNQLIATIDNHPGEGLYTIHADDQGYIQYTYRLDQDRELSPFTTMSFGDPSINLNILETQGQNDLSNLTKPGVLGVLDDVLNQLSLLLDRALNPPAPQRNPSPLTPTQKTEYESIILLDHQIADLLNSCSGTFTSLRMSAVTILESFLSLRPNSKTYDELITLMEQEVNRIIGQIRALPSHKTTPEIAEARKFWKENKVKILKDNFLKIREENFTYESTPKKLNADELKILITITPKSQLSCPFKTIHTIKGKITAKGKTKVDFSTGIFTSFGDDDFLAKTLQFERSNSDPTMSTVIEAESQRKAILSFGALAHFYRRSANNVKIGGTVGVSTTSGFDTANFHAGVSLILGSKSRFVISTGLTLRESFVPAGNYIIGQSYLTENLPDIPPTVKAFPEAGWFMAFTYNWIDPSKQ